MDGTTVSFATEIILDILLISFSLVSLSALVCTIQSAIHDHKREKREQEQAKRDLEYHERRMKEFK